MGVTLPLDQQKHVYQREREESVAIVVLIAAVPGQKVCNGGFF